MSSYDYVEFDVETPEKLNILYLKKKDCNVKLNIAYLSAFMVLLKNAYMVYPF